MEINLEKAGGVVVAVLSLKELDAGNVKEFKKAMEPALTSTLKLVADISALQFVDSSGLGAFLSCLRRMNATGGDMKLCGMSKPVRALFELVRMHRIFDVFNTRDEAVRAFQ